MPKTVTLIRCRSGFANVPDSFVVYEPGDEGAIDEYNEELGCYELPEGFTVAETVSGEHEIFKRGQRFAYEIVMHRNTGRPQLVTSDPAAMPVLRLRTTKPATH